MRIRNQFRQTIIAEQGVVADTFWTRMRGLIGRNGLKEGEVLLITRCQSIHMVLMRFSIDAIFIDKQEKVVGLVKHLKPFQFSPFFINAQAVLELPVGTIERTRTQIGDVLEIDYGRSS